MTFYAFENVTCKYFHRPKLRMSASVDLTDSKIYYIPNFQRFQVKMEVRKILRESFVCVKCGKEHAYEVEAIQCGCGYD